MRNMRMSTNFKVVPACVPSAGAVAAMTAVEVAGAGYDRAMFILSTGAVAATGVLNMKIQNSATSGGALADISGAAIAEISTATAGSKIYIIDVPVSTTRTFMKIVGAVTTDTAANGVVCILYRGVNYPVDTAYATQLVTVA
jgi:hypothetical protein